MALPITQERAKELLDPKNLRLGGNMKATEAEWKDLGNMLMNRPDFPGTMTINRIVRMIADGKLKE